MVNLVEKYRLDKFKGKRVLVTGDTGFKGSWLCLWLHLLQADVRAFALPPEGEDQHYNLLDLDSKIEHVNGDIREYSSLEKVFSDFQPEIVFHLAAQALVKESYLDPKTTFDTNVAGSVNVLEAIRASNYLRSVIYVTSDKCYKNKEWLWGYRENDELGGHDPYSASKAASEIVFSSYLNSFFSHAENIGVASVRAGNVIGGGDWSENRIVPDCITSLKETKPIKVRNPESTRPWQHVLEPLSGYLLLALKLLDNPGKFSGNWNFGSNASSIQTVHKLAKRIVEIWGQGEIEVGTEKQTEHESQLLQLNCDKAHQLLNWYPRWNFDQCITKTTEWYKKMVAGERVYPLSTDQINCYISS